MKQTFFVGIAYAFLLALAYSSSNPSEMLLSFILLMMIKADWRGSGL